MPIDGVFRPSQYDLSTFGAGVIPRLPDGGVELALTNAIQDQWLRSLEFDGAPTGWGVSRFPVDDGYDVYLGTTRANMSRYNTDTVDSLDDAYEFNKPAVGGGKPPNANTPDITLLAQRPEKPQVTKVDAAIVGYPQGAYLAAKSIVGKGKKSHTELTNTVYFEVGTDGQVLEWQAGQDLPQEAYGEGLWLTAPVDVGQNPDASTIRLQAVRKKGPRTYTTRGPLKLGSHARKQPNRNETKIGQPNMLKRGGDFRLKGGLGHDLQPGRYKFSIVQTTHAGESRPSDVTDPIQVLKEHPHNGWIFHPKHLHPDASGFKIFAQVDDTASPIWYQLVRTEKGDKFRRFARVNKPIIFGYKDSGEGKTQLPVMPAEPEPKLGATTLSSAMTDTTNTMNVSANASFPNTAPFDVKVGTEVIRVTGGAGTNTWDVARGREGTKPSNHVNGADVVEDKSEEKREKRDRPENRHFWLLAQADPPTEDSTGIENPTGDIDAPMAKGLGRPGAGTWWVSYGRRFDGRPTQTSEPVKVTLPDAGGGVSDKVIQLRFPPRVNKVFNALYGQLNQKGIPIGWKFRKGDTSYYTTKDANLTVEPGIVRLRTSGTLTTNDRYPRAISWDNSGTTQDLLDTVIATDRNRIERIRCTLEVGQRGAGQGFVELVQFDDTGTELSYLTLGTLATNGFLYIDKTIGDSSLTPTPDLLLNSSAAYLGIRWGAENVSGSRNLQVAVYNLFFTPFNAAVRRFEDRGTPDDEWIPSLEPAAPLPGSHVLAIGPAPPTAGDVQAAPTPLDIITHTAGSGGQAAGGTTLGSGAIPPGWSKSESHPGVNSECTIVSTGVFGTTTNAARFRSDQLNNFNYNYFQKNYATGWPGGQSLAVRFLMYIERLPTKESRSVVVARIAATNDWPLGSLLLWHDGTLSLQSWSTVGNLRTYEVTRNLRAGDIVDAEMIAGSSNSTNGTLTSYYGVNGGRRTRGRTINDIDWSGVQARKVAYGGFAENNPEQKWTLMFDEVYATLNGYAGVIAPPATGPVPQPDRPVTGGVVRDSTPAGEVINQGYAFFLGSDALAEAALGHTPDEYFVKPGVQRTAALFLKPESLGTGMRVFILAAYNERGDRAELGCLSEQTGANAVANTAPGWYEMWMTYTPPDGFYRLRWEHQTTISGTYVWQEPVDAVGNLTTTAARDAVRVATRATTGTFSLMLQARVPETMGTNMENGWNEQRQALDVAAEIRDEIAGVAGGPVTYRARATDRTPPTTGFTGYQTNLDLVPDLEWVDLEITLRGDGTYSPVIPQGGATVRYSVYQPILLRADRTALPGGVLVGGDASSNLPRGVWRHDYDTEAPGGIALARAVTDRVNRLSSFAVRVYTRTAEDELAFYMLATEAATEGGAVSELAEWFIEDWWEQIVRRVRFYGPGEFEPEMEYEFLERRQEELGIKRIPRVMEIEQTQILEAHFLE